MFRHFDEKITKIPSSVHLGLYRIFGPKYRGSGIGMPAEAVFLELDAVATRILKTIVGVSGTEAFPRES